MNGRNKQSLISAFSYIGKDKWKKKKKHKNGTAESDIFVVFPFS